MIALSWLAVRRCHDMSKYVKVDGELRRACDIRELGSFGLPTTLVTTLLAMVAVPEAIAVGKDPDIVTATCVRSSLLLK